MGFSVDELELIGRMFEHAPILMGLAEGADHRLVYMNEAFRSLLGDRDIPFGAPVSTILPEIKNHHDEEVQSSIDRLNHIYETGEPLIINELKSYFDRTGDGTLDKGYFNVVYQPLKNAGGEVFGIFIAGYEVTDHVQARQEKMHSEKRLKLALNGANVGFWESNLKENTIVFASSQCLVHLGLTQKENLKRSDIHEVIHPDDRENVMERIAEAIAEDILYRAEFRVVWPDGSVHWLMGRGQCLYDEEGMPSRLIGITMDITEQKVAEEKLKEAVELRDNFLAIASHELQTPVTSIKASAQLFERQLRDEGLEEYADQAEEINERIEQLSRLTHNLLDISHIQEGKLKLERETFSLEELVGETVGRFGGLSHHTISVNGDPVPPIQGDPFRLGQVISNLLENAIKYSPEADRINVRYGRKDGSVILSVQDFGVGISENDRKMVFERFFKGDGADKETYPGFGIGLYICSRIMKRHGGEIWVEENEEKGSTFSLSLPVDE